MSLRRFVAVIVLALLVATVAGCRELYPVRKDRVRLVEPGLDQTLASPYVTPPIPGAPASRPLKISVLGTSCGAGVPG